MIRHSEYKMLTDPNVLKEMQEFLKKNFTWGNTLENEARFEDNEEIKSRNKKNRTEKNKLTNVNKKRAVEIIKEKKNTKKKVHKKLVPAW